jgi:hypothetical protein
MLTKLLFNYMTELTTGVIFLMSSLYGSGQSGIHVQNIINAQTVAGEQVATIESNRDSIPADTNDPKVIEAYLRKEYVNTPILVEIARCESNFKQFDKDGNIIRGEKNNADVGVMQINEKYHDATAKVLGYDLHTIAGNIAYAKHLYDEQGSKPWSASKKCWSTSDQVARK